MSTATRIAAITPTPGGDSAATEGRLGVARAGRLAAVPLPVPNKESTSRWKGRTAGPFAAALARLFGPVDSGFGILTYHRVAAAPAGGPGLTFNVPPARFEAQLRGLLDRGWEPLALKDVLARRLDGRGVPRSGFVVTFDDGYANNLTAALPVLRELRVPATIFLATAYLDADGPFPNDDWPLAGSAEIDRAAWRPMTTAECRELAADPLVDLGCHTHTHADFRGRPDALHHDLMLNRAVLEERFGVADPPFAFPYGTKATGFVTEELTEAARRAGVSCALTTEDELACPDGDPFGWGRFTAEDYDTAETLVGKLSGWYGRLRYGYEFLRGHRRYAGSTT